MTGLAYKRRIGWGTAFIAVYALVFNVILSSIVIAGISPLAAAAAQEFCSGDGNAAQSDADKQHGKTAMRCPLCVGHHVSGALPPPQPVLTERLPLAAPAVFAFQQRIVAHARSFDHLSRGPPAVI
jgi:hypothetical protein